MKNTLIVVGSIADKICYLNISKEEALEKYYIEEEITTDEMKKEIEDKFTEVIEFEEKLYAYEVYGGE